MRFVFFIALALMFSSCATTANYEKTLKSWVGGKENQLIMSWGLPSSTYKTDEGKFLTYDFRGNTTSTTNEVYGYYYTNTRTHYCKTTFFIDNSGLIKSYQYEGSSCRQ